MLLPQGFLVHDVLSPLDPADLLGVMLGEGGIGTGRGGYTRGGNGRGIHGSDGQGNNGRIGCATRPLEGVEEMEG